MLGQVVPVTPSERKILLGCGAAGGTAAIFGAPLAAVVLAIELLLFEFSTRAIVPLVVTEKLARQGVSVPRAYEPDILRHTPVHAAMTSPPDTLGADVTIAEARRRIAAGTHHAYPLVTPDGACAGIVTRGDLLADTTPDHEPVTGVASSDVVTVAPDDSMLEALELLVDEAVDQLPVVDQGRLVGICTRTDILRARSRHLAQERHRPPWALPWAKQGRNQRDHGR